MLLLEAKKAAGEWRTGASDSESASLDGGLCTERSLLGDGDLDDSAESSWGRSAFSGCRGGGCPGASCGHGG